MSDTRPKAANLPEVLARVAEARGEVAALRLAYHFGGLEIYVPDPSRLVLGHPFVEALGQDLALTLYELFGRGELTVPIGPVRQSGRAMCQIPGHLKYASRAEQARALGVHTRTVERARARERARRGDGAPE